MSSLVDIFGEPITYVPHGGTATTISAVVTRQPSQVQSTNGMAFALNTMEIEVSRDDVPTVVERMDKVRFPRHVGDANTQEFTVTKIVAEDPGLSALAGHIRLMVTA